MATMEFSLTNVKDMRDAAQRVVNGTISTPSEVTTTTLGNLTVLAAIGAALKKLNPEVAFWNAVLKVAVDYSNSLFQSQKNQYLKIYSDTYNMMVSNGYTRVRMEGSYSNSGAYGSDGVWYTVPVISGYPTITGYKLSNGTWILAS